MAFESLSDRLQETLKKVTGQATLTEANMEEMLREIRLALLEADVNYQVVKEFIANTKEKAIGQNVIGSLKPGQVLVKIVHDELVSLLGTEMVTVDYSKNPTIIMMVGLQGSGKTTTAGKIAKLITEKQGKKPLLVAGDIYRPAAIDQLKTLGAQLNIPVFSKGTDTPVETIVTEALAKARDDHNDVVIIDTAGRLQIDEKLMQGLANVKEKFSALHEQFQFFSTLAQCRRRALIQLYRLCVIKIDIGIAVLLCLERIAVIETHAI